MAVVPPELAAYPFKKARDLRSAMAKRLAQFLGEQLTFTYPFSRRPTHLASVYDEWASFEENALPGVAGSIPALAVLPDRPRPDADSLTPRIIEETWSGGDRTILKEDGTPLYPIGDGTGFGYALFAVAEKVVPMVVLVRAVSKPQRQAIVSALEDFFLEVEDGNPTTRPTRYGRVTTLPDYYDRPVRYTYEGHQPLDTGATPAENRWLAQFDIQAEAKQVVLRYVPGIDVRVQVVVDGELDSR